jgi:hypothetical protein
MEISEIFTLGDLGFYVKFRFPPEHQQELRGIVESIDIPTIQKEIQNNIEGKLAPILKDLGYFSAFNKDDECKLWRPEFQHAVDFYSPDRKIAIEVEKAEIKRVVHDILKLVNGTKTFRSKIKYGVLIVPDIYLFGKNKKNFASTLKQDIQFYFGGLLEDSGLLDILVICYKVESK